MKEASVYLNGSLVGFHAKPVDFVQLVKERRRTGKLPQDITVAYYEDLNEVYI
ncbi:hypothetical protein H0N95_02945, partial [Candidatus Micrarchaeota archaeon]|nr:hypothetical protein [Candidatus Micrarchaeota archaeon]